MYKLKYLAGLLFLMLLINGSALAAPTNDMMQAVQKLQHDWEVIKFNTEKDKQEAAYAELSKKAHGVSEAYPRQAEPLVWEAIILSTYAGAKGGFSALKLVKNARDLLLQAEKINPSALNGSIYASLGNLYHQVPGWPIGFGSDSKARDYFVKALNINPNGLEPNYFYGQLLYDEGEYEKALHTLNRALNAPPRSGREITDAGQRKEIAAIIEDVERQL